MSQVAERQGMYTASFDAFEQSDAFGTGASREARHAAFRRFSDAGFPTTRDEEWKFTSVAPIAATTFERATTATPDRSALAPYLFDEAIAAQLVVVNGHLSASLSSLSSLPVGVTVTSGAQALAAALAAETPTSHAFVDLNTAFFEDAIVIEIAAKAIVVDPIHVLFVASPTHGPALVSPRLVIVAGEHSQASIVESYADLGAGVSLTNAVTSVRVAPSAVLEHVKLQRQNDASFHMASMFVRLDRAATFRSQSITLGGRIVRNDVVSTLAGDGAECTLNGLYVAGGDTLVDNHTFIDHAMPHCPSHEVYKGILSGRSRAVFNGKILVREDAQKTNAKQTNKALLLSDDAQVNTKPQLEIFADDVKCTHGAAIGQLDEDAMFYLQARGIGVDQARNMLIHAFAGDVLYGIQIDAVRDTAMHVIEEKLSL